MYSISHIQVCNCAVFDSGLEGFIAVNGGHRFHEEEGDGTRNAPKEEKGKGWTADTIVRKTQSCKTSL